MLGGLLSAGASIIGGLLQSKAASDANKTSREIAEGQTATQREFAQNAIQWKVADAKAAGVHPLYALGANTVNYAPSSVGMVPEDGLGEGIAAAGQDLGRALDANSPQSVRDRRFAEMSHALQLTNMDLNNQLLAAQVAKARAGTPPAFPIPEGSSDPRPPLYLGGKKILTDPGTSNSEDFETRYGEPGEWITSPMIIYHDVKRNYPWLDDPRFSPHGWGQALRGAIKRGVERYVKH